MSLRNIVQIVEIDIDFCTLTWGDSPCTAALSASYPHKCFNSFQTCAVRSVFNKGVKTLRFVQPTFPIKDGNYIPALVSVTGREQQVNIAGYAKEASGIGIRASVDVVFNDFPYNDVLTDKYWQERQTGAAQLDVIGYKPESFGTFWGKFKSRNPNYVDRPLRVIQAHLDGETLVYDVVRHYVMSEIRGPDSGGKTTIVAKDILALADDEKAVAPVKSVGRISADMDAAIANFTLTPAGIGDEYPLTGYVTVGSELMAFTRTGDYMVVTRGALGSTASSHSVNDTVQVAYHVNMSRGDAVLYDLLVNYARVPLAYIDYADWQDEFSTWGAQFLLSTTITKPTGITTLLAEIAQLGVTIWWDEVAQKIRVKLNRPPDDVPVDLNDRNNIISIKQVDNEKDRATRIEVNYVQLDPTKELQDSNFARGFVNVYIDAEHPDFYGTESIKTINTRWLNHNDEGAVRLIATRLASRFRAAPVTYEVTLDMKEQVSLVDVVNVNSAFVTDVTGRPATFLSQVFYRKEDYTKGQLLIKLQRFHYAERYGRITENDRPDYSASTVAQKIKGTYIVGPSLRFADGGAAYTMI